MGLIAFKVRTVDGVDLRIVAERKKAGERGMLNAGYTLHGIECVMKETPAFAVAGAWG
jgi:hypothetical protein